MILKIRGTKSSNMDWWYVDSIRRIHLVEGNMVVVEATCPSFGGDADLFVIEGEVSEGSQIKYSRVNCGLRDGSEYVVVFNTEAYLCNDEGRTVEVFRC